MKWEWLDSDERPVLIAIAGSNGAGKTTFYKTQLAPAGLRFINADELSFELGIDAYAAARVADSIRRELVQQRESFVFETVFSDPVGDKVSFLKEVSESGYQVLLCFIGLSTVNLSDERVAMRVTQGGHDVPTEKLDARFPRTLANLQLAIQELPRVLVYDNSDLASPFRRIAYFEDGTPIEVEHPIPAWLEFLSLS